jgi:hypothetical protein
MRWKMEDLSEEMARMFRETANEIVPKDWGTFKTRIALREKVYAELRLAWLAGRNAAGPSKVK